MTTTEKQDNTNQWEERPFWRLHNAVTIKAIELPNGRIRAWAAWSYDDKGIVKCVVESKGMLKNGQEAELLMESAYSTGEFDFKGGIWIHRKATDADKELDLES